MNQTQTIQRERIDRSIEERSQKAKRLRERFPEWIGEDPTKRITWIGEAYRDPETRKFGFRLASEGMTPEEIKAAFPPVSRSTLPVNLRELIRALIVEEYRLVGKARPQGNVRGFYYTNILFTLGALGVSVNKSVHNTIDIAWDDVTHPDAELASYEGLNIVTAKRKIRSEIPLHSPYLRFILAVEKADYFEKLRWIADLFEISLFVGGGAPSRAEARALVRELKQVVALDQEWVFLTITDLDPSGVVIEDSFVRNFEEALQKEGVQLSMPLQINRLFLRIDQVDPSMIANASMPVKEKEEIAKLAPDQRKAFWTTIHRFEERLGQKFRHPNDPSLPIKVEMNVVSHTEIEETIKEELCGLIEDETLIMKPEIMRLVNEKRAEAIKVITDDEQEDQRKQKEEWLQPFNENENVVRDLYMTEQTQLSHLYTVKRNHIEEVSTAMKDHLTTRFQIKDEERDIQYRAWARELVEQAEELVTEERTTQRDLLRQIEALQTQERKVYEQIIKIQMPIREELLRRLEREEALRDEKKAEKDTLREEVTALETEVVSTLDRTFTDALKEAKEARKQRDEALEKLQEVQEARWGPAEEALKMQIETQLAEDKVFIQFEELEQESAIRETLTPLITHREAWKAGQHLMALPIPRFAVGSILTQAVEHALTLPSEEKETLKISAFRPAFTPSLQQTIETYVEQRLRAQSLDLEDAKPPEWDTECLQEFEEVLEKAKEAQNRPYHQWLARQLTRWWVLS